MAISNPAYQAPPRVYVPTAYWEHRARQFAGRGSGLGAVCSYGMPAFYNWMIHIEQRMALARWLRPRAGSSVLDVGCGVGRWSRLLAARRTQVTAVDISPTMIHQAQNRLAARGLADHCRFLVQDVSALDTGRRFDLVLVVTVLQHILDPGALREGVRRLAAQLADGGTMVVLEASPARGVARCDSSVFTARNRDTYSRLFTDVGLRIHTMTGVDPAPFRTLLLPALKRRTGLSATVALAAATAASMPFNLLFGRMSVERSWHTVFVLGHAKENGHVRTA